MKMNEMECIDTENLFDSHLPAAPIAPNATKDEHDKCSIGTHTHVTLLSLSPLFCNVSINLVNTTPRNFLALICKRLLAAIDWYIDNFLLRLLLSRALLFL